MDEDSKSLVWTASGTAADGAQRYTMNSRSVPDYYYPSSAAAAAAAIDPSSKTEVAAALRRHPREGGNCCCCDDCCGCCCCCMTEETTTAAPRERDKTGRLLHPPPPPPLEDELREFIPASRGCYWEPTLELEELAPLYNSRLLPPNCNNIKMN